MRNGELTDYLFRGFRNERVCELARAAAQEQADLLRLDLEIEADETASIRQADALYNELRG